ncbi:peptidoglycan editing factor PgeF [Haliangium sp.]|uniref:peptidoglycan editing factor PgeF n=1 Tax=Haliangium sp. TaxID=2663208 RepID=UPI003D0AACB7
MSVAPTPTDDIRVLRSPLIDEGLEGLFVHGFPERGGGVSEGLRASLNMGVRWGDEPAAVEINRRRLAAHAGYDHDRLVATKHVHGTDVWRVGEPLPSPAEFDGLVSDRPGVTLGAFAADCIPMVFADPVARVCGAAHAGWRGTVGKVAANVVARMQEAGCRPEDVRVALGPSIGPCCFEVGPEVVAAFREVMGDLAGMVVAGPKKDHIDLRVVTRTVLEAAGVAPDHVDDDPPCTMCNPSRFFSYRRDGRDGGMHMGFIGLRAEPA